MTKPGDSQTTKSEIDSILEIEKVKKEADRLMMNKLKEIEVLKTKVRNAETETALIKATGMNSPEMNAAKEEIEELKNRIANLEEAAKSKVEDECANYFYYLRYLSLYLKDETQVLYGVATDYARNFPDAPEVWLKDKKNNTIIIGESNIEKYSLNFTLKESS